MATGSTPRQREALTRQLAQGHTRVVAVGVDDYDADAGFPPRRTGRNDALALANLFKDLPHLHAEPTAISTIVSRGEVVPSRGEVIRALRRLAQSAGPDDRLLVFFSGHAHPIAGDLYLVPQDAFASDDPGCLISLSAIREVLRASTAKHKLVILDLEPTLSRESLEAFFSKISGVAILSSAPGEARSPNPQSSPFTAHLLSALQGSAPAALDARLLTLASLHDYLCTVVPRPVLHAPRGTLVLADFSGPVLGAGAFDVDGKLFRRVGLSTGGRSVSIKDILMSLSRTTNYTQEYLEAQANRALGPYLGEELGKKVSRLRARFRWSSSEVNVDGACITFPDGDYQPSYVATAKLQGVLIEELSLAPSWLEGPGMLADLLECLDVDPADVTFTLAGRLVPATCVPRLEAHGWQITSELAHKIEAVNGRCVLRLTPETLALSGLPLAALFAAEPDKEAVRTAAAALAILG
ncbi:MAG TPA: caspase family protein [Nannocystis sp.]